MPRHDPVVSDVLCVTLSCVSVRLSVSSGEVWSDEAQDGSRVPGVSCGVRDVAEVCVILDVGLQRGAGVSTARYTHSAISLSIK